ncbi:putative manganese-dependent inorganic diphosphatase [Acetobacterium sp. KB-1]|jgi:manganese-dependent inorganic pyrophosphatase|uniref:putative manganese-dependent inorganic diphosphatase n=1 Tax=Acetobacterium sp. KB-1 TaxID=2184575 RepID=UPI000DBEB287|nr:putative manganese-dependent inorganic diphosphatase [Acetobacterium sp. KB-1]AWW26018.1 putative manganese-dependent inorganic diphosphatase [Acetobacterium sp. KB-1]
MTHKVYVFGHRNPDTDSICSAIAYAHLKQTLGHPQVFPARLGPINKETQFVLDTFGADLPELIKDVKPQVSDLVLTDFSMANEKDSVSKTMGQIIDHPGRSLPVVSDDNKLIGMVSLSDIIPAYTDAFSKSLLRDSETPLKNIIELLSARVYGSIKSELVHGDVYTITEIKAGQTLGSEDILVTVEQDIYLNRALSTGAGIIIVSNASPEFDMPISNDYQGTILTVAFGPFEVIRLLCQGIPIKKYYQKNNLEYFMTYETIDDVKKNILTSDHDRFPVVDEDGKVISTISRSNLIDFSRKKVILVDHNERNQSIIGVEEAEIIEVIDHHRVAEIQTATPLYLRIEPVGCTATIVAKMYHENKIPIPRVMAGLMLSAIISDTLLFNSPTCTKEDRTIARKLGKMLAIDVKSYGEKMLVAGSNLKEMHPFEILSTDRKLFTMGSYKIGVSQINTGDFRGIFNKLDGVLLEMNKLCEEEHLDLTLLMVTDIILGGTELIIAGDAKNLAQLAFGFQPGEFSKYMNGVFSRKKQIVPPLMNASAY